MEGRRPPLMVSGLRVAKCQDPEPPKGQVGLAHQGPAKPGGRSLERDHSRARSPPHHHEIC
eukprot:10705501-Alexandrium_andersonii.AAC.1